MNTRAAVLFEVGAKLEIRDIEVKPPQAGEVLVRVAAGGVCHTDLHVMTGHLPAPLPAVPGHEGAGSWQRWDRASDRSGRGTTSFPCGG